jgi:ribosome recycling factor
VDYYGAISPLRTIAGISAPDAQSLLIQPYDISAMANIEKAILKSDLGITPSNDGKVIRINIPPLTAVRCTADCCWLSLTSVQDGIAWQACACMHTWQML